MKINELEFSYSEEEAASSLKGANCSHGFEISKESLLTIPKDEKVYPIVKKTCEDSIMSEESSS